MARITNVQDLESLYDKAVPAATAKVVNYVTPLYRRWIKASRFAIMCTVGPEGTDASPRGDGTAVVNIVDENTLHMADWRGNNRLDSLRNIVSDGRLSLLLMVPGCANVVRVNGSAFLTTDDDVVRAFEVNGQRPRIVIVMTIDEIYFQCARALTLSELWNADRSVAMSLPTADELLKEAASGLGAGV
ncbi:MAG: MSMEG_1061 family FMN-dependent PPOX-type flavoprotein [Pseudomonadota bacterium]